MSVWTPVKDEMLGYLFKLAQYIQDLFAVAEPKHGQTLYHAERLLS